MCQTIHLKILGLVTFSDLTLTLTWAKYETISLVSTFAWALGVHMESFGRKMLRLRSLRSATWKHPILTFDLTLTWHVTSILNFRKWFRSVSSRSFECRLVRLSTSIRFRDSRGGGRIRPPRLWWVQKQPRRWRVNMSWFTLSYPKLMLHSLDIDIFVVRFRSVGRGEPGEVGHQMSSLTHPFRQTLFINFMSLIGPLCRLASNSYLRHRYFMEIFFCLKHPPFKPLPNQCFIFLKLALKYVILPFLCSSSAYIILSVYFEQRQLCLETGIICVYAAVVL